MTNTNLKELELQIKDLNEVLLECLNHSPNVPESLIKIVKSNNGLKIMLEGREGVRELKKRRLTNKYIKTLGAFDIHEALEIDIKEARKKLKNFNFTIKEKNIIIKRFRGGVPSFLKNFKSKNGVSK